MVIADRADDADTGDLACLCEFPQLPRRDRQSAGRLLGRQQQAETVLSDYASPVVAQDCVYFVNKAGVLTCVDLASGRTHYRQRLEFECWSTPLVAGEHVYFFGKRGETHVVRAGPEFSTTAVNHLWDPDSPPLPETYTEAAGHERQGGDAEGGGPRRAGGMLARLLEGDRDGDGVLTKDELPPPFRRMGDQTRGALMW